MIRPIKKLINRILVNPRKAGLKDVAKVLDTDFGSHRGTPIDRALIEAFLLRAIPKLTQQSRVIEFSEKTFADKYCSESSKLIFNFETGKIIELLDSTSVSGDLLMGVGKDFEKVDLIIATQLLAFTANPFVAATSLMSMLKKDGLIIGTEPFCSPISIYDNERWGDFFRFTEKGLKSVYMSTGEITIDVEVFPLGNWTTTYGLFKGFCIEDNLDFEEKPDVRTATNIGYVVRFRK